MSLFEELKRRNVIRVASAYAILGWVLAQVAEFAFETFGAPDWVLKSLVIVLILGLPLVVFLAWAFELTPEGIKRDSEVDHARSVVAQKGRKLDRAIIVLLLVALAWFTWDRISPAPDDGPATQSTVETRATEERGNGGVPLVAQNSVAVLPFVAMSSGPDDEYFADGLTEEILNSLAALPQLLVTARTSAFSFKGKDVPVQEIAAVLHVEHIVEGSVRRSGDRLRVTAQLIRAQDGFHLWSETYDRDTGDTFRIQSDIAEKIALALNIVLDDESRAQMTLAKIRDPEAFVAFQKGRELFALAHGQLPQLPTLEKANAYFDRAIELEPNFYNAYVARNDYYTHMLTNHARDGQHTAELEQADLDEIRRALETNYEAAIRSAPAPGHRLHVEYDKALVLGNWRGLGGLTTAVMEQKDVCAGPDWIHLTAVPFGQAAAAVSYFERLQTCDPLGTGYRRHWAIASGWAGEFDKLIAIAGALDESGQRQNLDLYVRSLVGAGRIDEALTVIESEVRDPGHAAALQAFAALWQGDAEAVSRITAGVGIGVEESLVMAARLGDRDAANAAAASIDSRPYGHIPLLQLIYFCGCGAPFDLEATPTLARMLEVSGLSWPPPTPVDWPLKNW